MSNEKDNTNRPPKRYRAFALITYCNSDQVKSVLQKHDGQIRSYAYIVHDKDFNSDGIPKEIHIHLLLKLVNATTVEAVRNWFKYFTDSNDLPVNTLAQPLHDISSSFDYLTHDTEQARIDGKYQYSSDEVFSNDIDFWHNSDLQDQDNISLAIQDILNGEPLATVAIKYGRDFIIHYQSIKMLISDIRQQTGGLL